VTRRSLRTFYFIRCILSVTMAPLPEERCNGPRPARLRSWFAQPRSLNLVSFRRANLPESFRRRPIVHGPTRED